MGGTVFEIAGGGRFDLPPPLVKGVGTKRLGKGRVKDAAFLKVFQLVTEKGVSSSSIPAL